MNKYVLLENTRLYNEINEEFGSMWEENGIQVHGVGDDDCLYISSGGTTLKYKSSGFGDKKLAPTTLEKYFREKLKSEGEISAMTWLKKNAVGLRVNDPSRVPQRQTVSPKTVQKLVPQDLTTLPYTQKGNPAKDNKAFNQAHNQRAYEQAKRVIEREGKCVIVQATGTGKSSIFSAIMDDYASKGPCMFISPSEGVNDQMRGHNKDNKIMTNGNYHDTLYQSILADYKNGFPKFKKELGDKKLALMCVDELHRSGATEWNKALDAFVKEFTDDNTIMVGASATPERDDGSSTFLSDAKQVSNYTLEEAIEDGVLPMPNYWNIPQYDEEDLNNIAKASNLKGVTDKKFVDSEIKKIMKPFLNKEAKDSRFEQFRGKLKQIADQNAQKGMGVKILGFAADIEDAEKITGINVFEQVKKAFPDKKVFIHSIHSKSGEADKAYVEQFRDDDNKYPVPENEVHILMAVNMFNEGIHARDVDTVVMGRKTKSNIIYSQQIGRVLDVSPNKEANIFDFCNNSQDSQHDWEAIHKAYERAGEPRGKKEISIDHSYEDALKECDCCIKANKPSGYGKYGLYEGHYRYINDILKENGREDERYYKAYLNKVKFAMDNGQTFDEAVHSVC